MTQFHRIGDAAAQLGIAAHVLRHWEDVGVLIPPQAAGGQRQYDDELLTRARLIQICQRAGLSLTDIRNLFTAPAHSLRVRLIENKQDELRIRRDELQAAIDFLDHTLTCRHQIGHECDDCVRFSGLTQKSAAPSVS